MIYKPGVVKKKIYICITASRQKKKEWDRGKEILFIVSTRVLYAFNKLMTVVRLSL